VRDKIMYVRTLTHYNYVTLRISYGHHKANV